jgi:hypothetical protein
VEFRDREADGSLDVYYKPEFCAARKATYTGWKHEVLILEVIERENARASMNDSIRKPQALVNNSSQKWQLLKD